MEEPPSGMTSTRSIATGGMTVGSAVEDKMPWPTRRRPSTSISVFCPPVAPRFRRLGKNTGLPRSWFARGTLPK